MLNLCSFAFTALPKWFIVKNSATSIIAKISALRMYGRVKTTKVNEDDTELYYLTKADADALVRDAREILQALDEN